MAPNIQAIQYVIFLYELSLVNKLLFKVGNMPSS